MEVCKASQVGANPTRASSMLPIKIKTIKDIWQKDCRIERAREIIIPKINKCLKSSKIKFDAQDLEHQILFRMTTMKEGEAFDKLNKIFKEQKGIVVERMKNAVIPPDKLFQFGFLRKQNNHLMKWDRETLFSQNTLTGEKKEVIFREIKDLIEKEYLASIINDYHYIHYSRNKGWLYGFFIKGKNLPFALVEVEPCNFSRHYKKAILELLNINYKKCVEITRFYSIPNTPKNIVGLRDKLTTKEMKKKHFNWIMTATMPCFSKTKSTTIAGGIDNPIFAKRLSILFFERKDGKWEFCVNRRAEKMKNTNIIKNKWGLFPVIEVIKPIKKGHRKINKDKYRLYYVEN